MPRNKQNVTYINLPNTVNITDSKLGVIFTVRSRDADQLVRTMVLRHVAADDMFSTLSQLPPLQGNITYELVGDFIAQQFFGVHPFNGDIFVKRSLKDDAFRSGSYDVSYI